MKALKNALLAGCAVLCAACTPTETNSVFVDELTCEYLSDPLCVDAVQPRLAWKLKTTATAEQNQLQTAYQILVASSPELLAADNGDLWNSGKVRASENIQIAYGGAPLKSMQRYWWKVKVWNNHRQQTAWSEPAQFGTGILAPDQWQGRWIGDQPDQALREYLKYVADNCHKPDFDVKRWTNPPYTPSPLLRKDFTIGKRVKRATLYASALGYYEMWLNGKRIGNCVQAPEWTNYFREVQYQAYDLTGALRDGDNALAATLADGWALGRLGAIKWMRSFPHRGFYAPDRRLIAQLLVEYADGSNEVIATDSSWKINTDGYVLRSDNFVGETIDARKIIPGWNNTGFDDAGWRPAYVDETVKRTLVAQPNEPIRVHATLKPVEIIKWNDKYIANFGQNIAGHCELRIKGKRGQTITLRHGEWRNNDGSIYTQSLGYATATDEFILSGGNDVFRPEFTYHGFQYVEVSGLTEPLTADMISAKAVSSDPPVTGAFECSNPLLNKLFDNVVWTQRNNMFSVMHDNPSRDERTGATGDVQIFAQASIFNMDMAAFFTKFVHDCDESAYNGQFFSMIPSLEHEGFWKGWVGAPGWAEAGFIVPWRMYVNYGDTRGLEELYGRMKRHVEATREENPDLIWKVRHNHNGDWLNANTIANPPDTTYNTRRGATPDDVFSTAFFAYSTQLLVEIAKVLDKPEDAQHYGELAAKIKDVFVKNYVKDDGTVEGATQGAYSLALHYDLIPENLRQKAFNHLLDCIKEYDYRLSTGFITTPMMMEELSKFGRDDVAYRLLESERFPSWLYLVKIGATTVWERWDGWLPDRGFQSAGMNSLDHVAFGAVSEWMFRHVLGINPDEEAPGYAHFTLKPVPGGSLRWAKGSYNSIRGKIVSDWKLDGETFNLNVSVPPNTTATVLLPDGTSQNVGSGNYAFSCKIKK
jgi:alpha-L-rhamnosidase